MNFGDLHPDFHCTDLAMLPIIGSKRIKEVPLAMFEPFRAKIMVNFGRTLENLALRRGLSVHEALWVIRTTGTMPPKEIEEEFLAGEVSIWEQCVASGRTYGPGEVTIDYSDCDPVQLKGAIGHLRYTKMVENEASLVGINTKPLVLYITKHKTDGFSFENGVKVCQNEHIHAVARDLTVAEVKGWLSPAGRVATNIWESQSKEIQGKIDSLFDAIKHGDEDYQEWLKEAIRCHFSDLPMPEYVAGKSSKYIHRPDEPFFVLLGRDPQAPDLVQRWADVRGFAEPADWKVESAKQIARDMRVFKAANPDFGMSRQAYVDAVSMQTNYLLRNRRVEVVVKPEFEGDVKAFMDRIGKGDVNPNVFGKFQMISNPDVPDGTVRVLSAIPHAKIPELRPLKNNSK